jgi:3',5'-cyclic AMP phosphodiesterase CpdA
MMASSSQILVTADLHYGHRPRGDRAVEALAEHVRGAKADAFVIAGDLAKSRAKLESCLELFEGFDGPKAALPGNHDVWVSESKGDSWEMHERLLPEIFERHGFHPLHLKPLRLPDMALVGTMGWYDYSFRDDIGIDLESYRAKTYPGDPFPIWTDAIFARFPMSDQELTALLVDRLGEHLRRLPMDERALVISHHLVTKGLLIHPRVIVPKKWRFANAFLGSERLGDLIEASPSVAQVICGHAHRSWSHHSGSTRYLVVGSDYDKKQLIRATATTVLERKMFW